MGRLNGGATWLVGRAHLRASRIVQEGLADAGSRPYLYRILAALDELGSMNQMELGRLTGIDRSDISLSLAALEDAGFAARQTDPSDRRQKLVSITESGRIELRRLDDVLRCAQDRFLAPLGPQERSDFLALITRLGATPGDGRDAAPPSKMT